MVGLPGWGNIYPIVSIKWPVVGRPVWCHMLGEKKYRLFHQIPHLSEIRYLDEVSIICFWKDSICFHLEKVCLRWNQEKHSPFRFQPFTVETVTFWIAKYLPKIKIVFQSSESEQPTHLLIAILDQPVDQLASIFSVFRFYCLNLWLFYR